MSAPPANPASQTPISRIRGKGRIGASLDYFLRPITTAFGVVSTATPIQAAKANPFRSVLIFYTPPAGAPGGIILAPTREQLMSITPVGVFALDTAATIQGLTLTYSLYGALACGEWWAIGTGGSGPLHVTEQSYLG